MAVKLFVEFNGGDCVIGLKADAFKTTQKINYEQKLRRHPYVACKQ